MTKYRIIWNANSTDDWVWFVGRGYVRQYPSLLGLRFGKLVVQKQLESDKNGRRRWMCLCDCGNTHVSTTGNLKSGHTTHCGCKKSPDLTGKVFGRLTVLGRSEKRGARGQRTAPLWECRCECGSITYKATDTLTNPDESMCVTCAGKNNAEIARKSAGFFEGTQLTKIRDMSPSAANTSGCRGVYYDGKTNRYRARIVFKRKIYSLGTFANFADAVKTRQRAEEELFGKFLSSLDEE